MIRTRFAPSPTGSLHIGGLRTALFSYLFAKKNNGKFILRIEDTDQSRKQEGTDLEILESFKALGILFDESFEVGGEFAPYVQSQRLEIYQKYANELLLKKTAYRCFCSAERLEEMRAEQKKKNIAPRYDGSCRKLSDAEIQKNLQKNTQHTVRLKINYSKGSYRVPDLLRGDVFFKASQLDEQVLLKSDGFPTYHLACVVDDHLMKISHVIRGEEWLPSTPKHLQIYENLGWQAPQFIHLPLLLAEDRTKLSKRNGDVAVCDYLKQGFLSECILNFIALLGWNPGTKQEIFSLTELIENFAIEKLSKSGAIFDIKKMRWMNQQYFKKLSDSELLEKLHPFLDKKYRATDTILLQKMIKATRNSLQQLNEINKILAIFDDKDKKSGEKDQQEKDQQEKDQQEKTALAQPQEAKIQKILQCLIQQIQSVEKWDEMAFKQTMKNTQEQTSVKGKELWMPVRLALTLQEHGPELPLIAEIFGKEKCIKRLDDYLVSS